MIMSVSDCGRGEELIWHNSSVPDARGRYRLLDKVHLGGTAVPPVAMSITCIFEELRTAATAKTWKTAFIIYNQKCHPLRHAFLSCDVCG